MAGSSSQVEVPEKVSEEHLPKLGKSLLWLVLFALVYFASAMLYFAAFGVVLGVQHADVVGTPEFQELVEQTVEQHAKSASGLSGMYLVQFVLLLPVVLYASHFPAQHFKKTLGLKKISLKSLGQWLLILLAFFLAEFLIGTLFKIDNGVFIKEMNGSKSLFLVFVFIVLAPVLEETIFRGYFFKAWRNTRIGLSGTLLVTSVLFVLIHWGQYGLIQYLFLFAFSVLLGLARERSGSIWMPIILHGTNNLLPAVYVIFLGLA